MASVDAIPDAVPFTVGKGKGKGKGRGIRYSAPPPPSQGFRPPPKTATGLSESWVKVKTGDGTLTATPYTIVTRSDGTRYMEHSDGSVKKLPKDWQDQEGKWSIMNENA